MSVKENPWADVEKIKLFFAESQSAKGILDRMNRPINSTSYRQLKNFASSHNLIIPEMTITERALQNRDVARLRVPNSEIFVEHSTRGRAIVKRRALSEGLLEYKCYGKVCEERQTSLNFWKEIVLQLEHKNGIGDDNRLENLELLCPNCHSMTSTYGSSNPHRYENGTHGSCQKCGRVSKTKLCHACNSFNKQSIYSTSLETIANSINQIGFMETAEKFGFSTSHSFQKALNEKHQKVIKAIGVYAPIAKKKATTYPSVEILVSRVKAEGYSRVARDFNVSDNALRKHLKKELNGELPTAKYGKPGSSTVN